MNQLKRILIVDDERKIREVIASYLENEGYNVLQAENGAEALRIFNGTSVDLVVLDLMLPDISGEEVCRQIRRKAAVPIIMLTARVEEDDILNGLKIGADDYVIKPFSPRQLTARVNAVLRRTANQPFLLSDIAIYNNELVIDSIKHEVRKNDVIVNLTPIEYKLLITLAKYPSKVFTRDELIDTALRDDFPGYDRAVDSHIKNLRKKIETDTKSPQYIITVHGVGYRFGGEKNEL